MSLVQFNNSEEPWSRTTTYPNREETVEVLRPVQISYKDAVSGMSQWTEILGKNQNPLERLYITTGLEELESGKSGLTFSGWCHYDSHQEKQNDCMNDILLWDGKRNMNKSAQKEAKCVCRSIESSFMLNLTLCHVLKQKTNKKQNVLHTVIFGCIACC